MKRMDFYQLPNIVAACITLHNFQEIKDNFNIEEWTSRNISITYSSSSAQFSHRYS